MTSTTILSQINKIDADVRRLQACASCPGGKAKIIELTNKRADLLLRLQKSWHEEGYNGIK